MAQDLLPTIHTDVTPPLRTAAEAPKGVRFVAAGLRKLSEWRAIFTLIASAPDSTKSKLLTHSGDGNVTIIHYDIPHP